MSDDPVPQPPFSQWRFVEELKAPLHDPIHWRRDASTVDEVDLRGGVGLEWNFPDPEGVLDTALRDFKAFLGAAGISANGAYPIRVEKASTPCHEAYRLEVGDSACIVQSDDMDGIRRALVFLEDEISRTGGPFLAKGLRERRPVIRTRISRCFFGPIKRPPMNRDELADSVDYYPDEYLNRLAHEGVNGLWLTVKFMDLCPSEFFPEFGVGREKSLAKLRATVKQCARYGIRIYPFCIEPQGFGDVEEYMLPSAWLDRHPELGGHKGWAVNFCTSTAEGQRFLESCAEYLFSQVPGLGGLIAINMGERPTNCYSEITHFHGNNCPRCSKRKPWEVLADTQAAFARGMHRVNPDAEMISWLYVPYMEKMEETKAVITEIAAHTPIEVTLQYNFESAGEVEQLGRKRIALDYWLAWPGPSDLFEACARNAIGAGARMSAKIQVGCSHEIATIPFIPVPGNLWRKYRAMHRLGVSTVMQCWYFGNYPGLMNKAAGELSFAPFEESEDAFLRRLASLDWPGDEDTVVSAWRCFQEGYSHFPVNLPFTWYGPLHQAVVWPLHLIPVDKPVPPSWKFTFPDDAGDRIGECMSFGHSLPEVLHLLGEMDARWQQGVALLSDLRSRCASNAARMLDIGLAEAIGLQIRSARNIYRFYDMRERLPHLETAAQLETLAAMKSLCQEEMEHSNRLSDLCRMDSRLGFHSEAEGYKYFPEKLAWRVGRFEEMLRADFPRVETMIRGKVPLFPQYTGASPEGKTARAVRVPQEGPWYELEMNGGRWTARFDDETLWIIVEAKAPADEGSIMVEIEPRRLWPTMKFEQYADGTSRHHNKLPIPDRRWSVEGSWKAGIRQAKFRIPFAVFKEGDFHKPLRVNISSFHGRGGEHWVHKNPWPERLFFGNDNPADLGWLFF